MDSQLQLRKQSGNFADVFELLTVEQQEQYIHRLTKALGRDFEEQVEKSQQGFSFKSSLRDIFRNLMKFLLIKGGIETTLDILSRWEYFINASKDQSILKPEDTEKFSIFCGAYYPILEYFKTQFRTHLGEKIEFDESEITDPKVLNFIKTFKMKQRNYPEYSLDKFWLVGLVQSGVRSLEMDENERELTELLNLIFLYKSHPEVLIEEVEILVMSLNDKFPSFKKHFEAILHNEAKVEIGQSIIEISPPYESYSFQHNVMIRVYTLVGSGYQVNQYALPYDSSEVEFFQKYISQNSTDCNTFSFAKKSSNKALANLAIQILENPQTILNSFPSILENGGIGVMNKVEELISPKIETLVKEVQPFVDEIIAQVPMMMFDPTLLNNYVARYREVFSAAVASRDKEIQAENPLVSSVLSDFSVLREAVAGGDTAKVLEQSSGGSQSSVDFTKEGDCDNLAGSIGNSAAQSGEKIFSQSEVLSMQYNGEVMKLTKGKDIELKLQSFKDSTGKEYKLFRCPICEAKGVMTYVDICNAACSVCKTSTQDMRLSAEKQELGEFVQRTVSGESNRNDQSSDGIFGAISGLFNVIFGFGWL